MGGARGRGRVVLGEGWVVPGEGGKEDKGGIGVERMTGGERGRVIIEG